MRVLIDTNIFIYREDDHVISDDLQRLLSIMQNSAVTILVHPLSVEDLEEDPDKERMSVMLSKVRAYPFLERPPSYESDTTYRKSVDINDTRNSRVDNGILYALYKNAVDFLITEDRLIHKKARKLGIDDRVFLVSDALLFFNAYVAKDQVIVPPALVQEFAYNINVADPIFSSLKASYPEFESWFKKISREGRKCWVYFREDSRIGALLIYKIEDEAIEATPFIRRKRRLKVSSFKVTHVGYKIGELFINIISQIAVQNNIQEIYFTIFPGTDDRLIDLVSEYGFSRTAMNPRGEEIYIKKVTPDSSLEIQGMTPLDIATKYYPSFYDGPISRKFILPVRPSYHNKLFTSYFERQLHLTESKDFLIEGNAIRKAYICHSKSRQIHPGDILLFYVTQQQKVTSLGVVESVDYGLLTSSQIIRRVGKRTVFSLNEIEEMCSKPTTVIMFRHHFHFQNAITFGKLKSLNVLKAPPQSVTQLTDEAYRTVLGMDGIDERYTFH
jgi:rRNA-processing protein FCF1